MGFVKVQLDEVKEGQVVPEGEYELRIIKVEDGESKKGNMMTTVLIKIEDAGIPNPNVIRHWLVHPTSDLPPDQKQMRLLDIKRFLTLFGVAFDRGGFDSDDLLGQTAKCEVRQEEGEDKEIYNRLRLPRLKE